MEAINYCDLLGRPARATSSYHNGDTVEYYRDDDAVQYRSRHGAAQFFHEIVRLADDALLLSTDSGAQADICGRQSVDGGDWIHFQFRLDGEGYERVSPSRVVQTTAGTCIVSRYPEDSLIERRIVATRRRRYVCLFMRPSAVIKLIDAPARRLPDPAIWIGTEAGAGLQSSVLQLGARMSLAAHEVLGCSYSGVARRAFMRAKSIELIAAVIEGLGRQDLPDGAHEGACERLGPQDRERIAVAYALLNEEDAPPLTIDALARRVGLNRSKLAAGFKQTYGMPIRQYWRGRHLDRAREALEKGGVSVTEVALSMGYGDTYSFTRAFSRRFGVLPSAARSK